MKSGMRSLSSVYLTVVYMRLTSVLFAPLITDGPSTVMWACGDPECSVVPLTVYVDLSCCSIRPSSPRGTCCGIAAPRLPSLNLIPPIATVQLVPQPYEHSLYGVSQQCC